MQATKSVKIKSHNLKVQTQERSYYRKFHAGLIVYELRNISGNIFVWIFGVAFPILMSILLGTVFLNQIPKQEQSTYTTSIFITMSLVIPMANILMGYSATFSQELEKDIPLRFRLFGYSEKHMLVAKMIAYLVFNTASFLLYIIVDYSVLNIQVPSFFAACTLIVSLYILIAIFFTLSHGIALLCKKFGKTYAICMSLYFGLMLLSGMFGVRVSQLPKAIKFVAYMLPLSYISEDFVDFWQGGSYNFVPFIQSFIFFGAISLIILIIALRRDSFKKS